MSDFGKKLLVEVECHVCGHAFDELIAKDREQVVCPECKANTPAYRSGLGFHRHNRYQPSETWKVRG